MIFNVNIANVLILALINLNTTLAEGGRENKTISYPTFSEREDEDVNNFINKLEKDICNK